MKESRAAILFGVAVTILALVMFRGLLWPDRLLFASDANVGWLQKVSAYLPWGFLGHWDGSTTVGTEWMVPLSSGNVVLWLLGASAFNNWVYAIHMVLASLFLAGFLRRYGLAWTAAGMGLVTAFWIGSNFTLLYAGHIGKFEVLLFASAFLYLFENTLAGPKFPWGIMTGGALGAMFLDQPDLALFFAIVLGLHAAFRCWLAFRGQVRAWAGIFLPILATAAAIAGPAALAVHTAEVGKAAQREQNEESARAKWEFATQWSLPPDEVIDFVAPGYTGWRSGEPDGPYWGRTGRSAEWEQTGRGFMNFRLESIYIGMVPLALSLFAAGMAVGRQKFACVRKEVRSGVSNTCGSGSSETRHLTLFWAAAALLSLLLAFGKYFPLYAVFYQLPGIKAIRNPNKFVQIFQFAVGILAACGLDMAMRLQTRAKQPE